MLIFAVIFIAVLAPVYFYAQNFIEPKAYDFMSRITLRQKASDNIVTVVIDDESLSKVGRWPWKRTLYTDIFDYLENYAHAKVIAFDSIIISNDTFETDSEFFNIVGKRHRLIMDSFCTRDYVNNALMDQILKEKYSISIKDKRNQKTIDKTEYFGFSRIPAELLNKTKSIGSVLAKPDIDGVIRKIEPVFYYRGSYYPSLSLAVFLKLHPNAEFVLEDKYLKSKSGSLKIPITLSNGIFNYIKWYNPQPPEYLDSHKKYSAWKVLKSYDMVKNGLRPIFSPDVFRDKIVIVGATASAINDIKTTPLETNHPGVDIQATCIDNVLNNQFMVRMPDFIRYLIILGISMLTLIAVVLFHPLQTAIIATLLMLGYFHFSYRCFINDIFPDIITPHLFVVFFLTVGFALRYFIEGKKKDKIQSVMGKYISKDVVEEIMKNIDEVKPGGDRAEITVLFADIRDFTTISETIEPEKVSSILNEYFGEIIPIINKYSGVLNKFMGDAILVVFGAPIYNKKHPENAVLCAIEIINKVKSLQKKWIEEGKPKIEIGAGINTGIAFVGNVGSNDRLEYTVIGDTVNVAYRIESYNKLYNTHLLISSSTYEKVKELVDVIKIDCVDIKGKAENIDIFEVVDLLK